MSNKFPLVSVIIPMYNSAKFIPQTLESLLYQTMTDFEVVVVDDGSTDNSVAVVKSYASKLNLNVVSLPKNSGISSIPRNVGIQLARGKYVAFLDSDDLLTKTALEELSTLAEEHKADIVHTNQFFKLWGGKAKSPDDPAFSDMNELTNPNNYVNLAYGNRSHPNKPTLLSEDMSERIDKFIRNDYTREPYTGFYRRDFLITNQIKFPNVYVHHDEHFAFHALCLAKNVLCVSNVYYIVRPRSGSIMREKNQWERTVHRDVRIRIDGFNAMIKIMDGIKFFAEHPDYRYAVLNWYIESKSWVINHYKNNSPAKMNQYVEKEFHSDDAFAAYLFNTMCVQRLQIAQLQDELKKLKESQK